MRNKYAPLLLLDRTRTFLGSQRRTLRKRGRAKLIVLRSKFIVVINFLVDIMMFLLSNANIMIFLGFILENMILKDFIIVLSLSTVIIILTILWMTVLQILKSQ